MEIKTKASHPITEPLSIYLAAPYSGSSEQVSERMQTVDQVVIALRNAGHFVTSALLHHSSLFPFVDETVDRTGKDYWLEYSRVLVAAMSAASEQGHTSRACELWVLCLPGFQESSGVSVEIQTAESFGIPVRYFLPMGSLRELSHLEAETIFVD